MGTAASLAESSDRVVAFRGTLNELMAARDPAKRALNAQIAQMTAILKTLQPHVMTKVGAASLPSLHAVLGSKNANFIEDIKTRVLRSPDDYYTDWLDGLDAYIAKRGGHCARYSPLVTLMCRDSKVEQYVELFIKRTFLRQSDDLSKKRPTDSEAAVWLGQNHASYGLLVTPRFNPLDNDWENDNSEIRHFKLPYFYDQPRPAYWSCHPRQEQADVLQGRR